MRTLQYSLIAVAALLWAVESAAAQSADKLDILGVHLGSTRTEALAILHDKLPDASFKDASGSLTMGQYTSPAMIFGVEVGFTKVNDYHSYVHVAFDQHDPQTVLAVSRYQLFKTGEMPSLADTEAALVEKFGKPQIATGNPHGNQLRTLIWHFGTDPSMLVNFAHYTSCLSYMSHVGAANYAGQDISSHPQDAAMTKCGTWGQVMLSPWSQNPELVANIQMEIGDVPRAKASVDLILNHLAQGDADIRKKQTSGASKPRL